MPAYKNRNSTNIVDLTSLNLQVVALENSTEQLEANKVSKSNIVVASGSQPSASVVTNATGNFTFTPTLPGGVVIESSDLLFYYPGSSAGLDYAYLTFHPEFLNSTSVTVKYYNTSGVTANISAGTGRLLIVKAGLNT